MAKRKKSANPWQVILIVVLALLLALLLGFAWQLSHPEPEPPVETTPPPIQTDPPLQTTAPTQDQPANTELFLGQGLVITRIAPYTGAYMEDGTDHVLSDVMMVILENRSGQALQYATFRLQFADTQGEFSVTTLPAGARAVVLEQNRMVYIPQTPEAAVVDTAVFLDKLELYPDLLEISGQKGLLTVKNISETPIVMDIYIYYKNSAQDIFYGGITYRARLEGGLAPGESKQVLAAHYNPAGSTVLMVTVP